MLQRVSQMAFQPPPGSRDRAAEEPDELHSLALRMRPVSFWFNSVQALFFGWLAIWPLCAVYGGGALFHLWQLSRARNWRRGELPFQPHGVWGLVLVQATVAVAMLGPGAGFQFYMLALLPSLVARADWPFGRKVLQVLLVAGFLIVCDTVTFVPLHVPALDPALVLLLRHINTAGACTMIATVSYALYVSLKEAQTRLRLMATTDPLTGLFNRRHMMTLAERELARCQRAGRPLSVVIADIDHFKQINDTFGHAAGDAVLVAVSAVLSDVREYDCVARWGGEEFMLLLPDTGEEAAVAIAERLRHHVECAVIRSEETVIPVRMTLGVAVVRGGETWQAALERADEALYRGKESGRNRVVSG